MLINEDAFSFLAGKIDDFEAGRSSHWRLEQNNFSFNSNSFSDVGPMGTFSQSTSTSATIGHFLFQIPFRLFGLRYKHFLSVDKAARIIAKLQGRQYDLDLLRHVLTLVFLRKHIRIESANLPICVIGDGYGNMTSVILATIPKSKVIIINLHKSLIVDLICIKRGVPNINYAVARTSEELGKCLSSEEVRVVAIGANDAKIINGVDLALAINIESMMEMDPPIIQNYFDLLRSGPADTTLFYCCNLEFKKFSGEGTSNFYEYPWRDDDKILIHETCPWTKIRYGNTFPFFSRRVSDVHRLVHLKNSN